MHIRNFMSESFVDINTQNITDFNSLDIENLFEPSLNLQSGNNGIFENVEEFSSNLECQVFVVQNNLGKHRLVLGC